MMMRVSTRLYEYYDKSRLENLIKSRLEKLCGFPDFYARVLDKSPVRWYARFTHNTLAHYLQIHYTFYMDSIQITKPNKTLIYI